MTCSLHRTQREAHLDSLPGIPILVEFGLSRFLFPCMAIAKKIRFKNLRTIPWLPKYDGGRVTITSVNGIDKALDAVSRELEELPPPFVKYLKPTAGTYNCREVAGSQIRSMHAYGAALDINTAFANYWRWDSKSGSEPIWKNRIPIEIVRVFERHGFIWGGYWYHYDTMHFEYRLELLSEVSDK